MPHCDRRSRLLLAFTLLARAGLATDAFADRWHELKSQQRTDVALDIAVPKGAFYVGETIPVTLTFSTSAPGNFNVAPWPMEHFVVDPADGADDLLKGLFSRAFAYSGPGPSPLSEKPQVKELCLNHYIRFRGPGTYRLYISSKRLSRFTTTPPDYTTPEVAGMGPVDVVSNIVTLRIDAASASWIKQQIADAIRILDAAPTNEEADQRRQARRTLLYLDTWDALVALSTRLDVDGPELDLLGSQHRTRLLPLLEARLVAPEQRVTYAFINLILQLAEAVKFGPYDPSQNSARLRFRVEKEREYYHHLTVALQGKAPEVRGDCAITLLSVSFRPGEEPAWLRRVASWVVANFSTLSAQTQWNILQGDTVWSRIKSAELIPALRDLYSKGLPRFTVDALVKRLYELDPAEGRNIIISEIEQRSQKLMFSTLAMLPDTTLPELDESLARQVEEGGGNDEIIVRYASPAIVQRIERAYLNQSIRNRGCISPLVFYFLRCDPLFGERELRRYLATPPPNGSCWNMDWAATRVGRYAMSPALERLAIEYLSSGAVIIKQGFAELLRKYGSAAAEQPLWETIAYFHQWWRGREAEFYGKPGTEARRFEWTLVGALTEADAWKLDRSGLNRLLDLCISRECKVRVKSLIR